MRKLLIVISFLMTAAVACAMEKVILDTDMVEGFDDGVALMLLANAPNVDLLGVTIVAGNTWVAEGTAYAVRQLEIAGRKDVPVHMGMTRPLRPGRVEGIELERKMFGAGTGTWIGAMNRPDPQDWREAYRARYEREPEIEPETEHAVNFIIDAVRANPGEVTIVAIGPLGNLALAVRMAPDIVPLVKKIVYMGGAFFQPGNVTPAAEFNWWFDPEAARITVHAPFREQIVFGLDVCEKVAFTRGHFQGIVDMLGDTELGAFIKGAFVGDHFEANPKSTHFIWDVLTAVSLIEPSLVLNHEDAFIDVVDAPGLTYGQSVAYLREGPVDSQKATIVTDINKDRFWEMMYDSRYWRKTEEKE